MNLLPTFSHYYPDGYVGGQCGDFAHNLVDFPPVGDTVQSKRTTVQKYGTLMPCTISIGDVVIFDIGQYGHVAVVNDIIGSMLQLTESNWNLDQLVHHNRQVPNDLSTIIGIIKGPLKVQIIPMNIKLRLLDNREDRSLQSLEIADMIKTASDWSQGVLQLEIDPINTLLKNIPYKDIGDAQHDAENPNGLEIVMIDPTWYEQVVGLLGGGFDVCSLIVADQDWKGSVNGSCYPIQTDLPVAIQCHAQDLTEALNLASTGHYGLSLLQLHELRHALCFIGQLNDDTHAWLVKPNGLQDSFLSANLDYGTIQEKIGMYARNQTPITYPTPANFYNWATESFSPETKAAIEANATGAHNIIFNGEVIA